MIAKWNYFFLFSRVLIALLFLSSAHALAESCQRAIEFYNQAMGVEDLIQREGLLTHALSLPCGDKKLVAKIRNNLGDTYEKQDRLGKAIAEYHKAAEADPLLPTPYLSLGDIYTKLKRPKDAARFYEKGFLLQNYKTSEQIVDSLSPNRAIRVTPKVILYFGVGQANLNEKATRQLEALLNALCDDELLPYRFRIAGHTCNLGTKQYNQALSKQRAEAVKQWLIANNIFEERLFTVGFGEDRPIADNKCEEGRRRNRRVEISTTGVVMTSSRRGAYGQGYLQAVRMLREGERMLSNEQYRQAAEQFNKALKAFEKKKCRDWINAALKDLVIAHQFLGDWEKADRYRKQVQ